MQLEATCVPEPLVEKKKRRCRFQQSKKEQQKQEGQRFSRTHSNKKGGSGIEEEFGTNEKPNGLRTAQDEIQAREE